jgi:hypothetical protein
MILIVLIANCISCCKDPEIDFKVSTDDGTFKVISDPFVRGMAMCPVSWEWGSAELFCKVRCNAVCLSQ